MKKYFILLNLIIFIFCSCEPEQTLSESNEILKFVFLSENNSTLQNDYSSIIDGNNISITLPYDADTEKLIASIETNGNSIEINNIIQEPGVTINSFSETVFYDVIAENGNINSYTVEVSIENTNCIDNNPDYNPFTFNPDNYECTGNTPIEYCPIAPTVTAKFESNKKIIFEPKDFDNSYGGTFLDTYNVGISEGDKNVFFYTYHYQGKDFQSYTYKTIIFEIDNNVDEFLFSGINLLNLNFFYHNADPYGPSGKVIAKIGCVKGVKINESEWQIDINVRSEIKKENQESGFPKSMISEIFTIK
jgi:hypothetical protein